MDIVLASNAGDETHELSGSENVDALMDDDDLDLPGNRLFPSDAHLLLVNKVIQLKASNHAAFSLLPCLQAVHDILCHHQHGHRMRQSDLDSIRRFFKEDMLYSVDKMLQYPNSIKIPPGDNLREALLEALQWAACVAADALYYRAQLQAADVAADLDADLVPVAHAMLNLFNQHKQLHHIVQELDVPHVVDIFAPHVNNSEYAVPMRDDTEDSAEGQDGDEQPIVRYKWLAALINTFAGFHGFDAIVALLQRPAGVSFPLLNMMAAVLAQVIDFLTDEADLHHQQVVVPVLNHVMELVETDHERLHDYGNDRTYNTFQCLVNINMVRILRFGSDKRRHLNQLRRIQCTFVLKMLESSSFNKLLSGVRECNKLLQDAAKDRRQIQTLIEWIEQNDVVQRILRTNLHQKQYVQEVQGIMKVLTQHQFLTAEHLDMLWGVIEKEDTYEAVKTHMFELLGELAACFVPEQLNMLFAKLERSQERSVQDTKRLLTLLQHLAQSDRGLKMETKIIEMVWNIVVPVTAHKELQESRALTDVIKTYADLAQDSTMPDSGWDVLDDWIKKCFEELMAGRGSQVALLRLLKELIKALPTDQRPNNVTYQTEKVDQLLEKGLMGKLVDSLCTRVAAARKAVAAAKAEQLNSEMAGFSPNDEEAATAVIDAAIATLGEGGWSYLEIVKEYLMALRVLAALSGDYFDSNLAEKLWHALMGNPPYHEDQLQPTQVFFRSGFQGDKQYGGSAATFDHSTQQILLEKHMVRQDASKVAHTAAKLFIDIFNKVNLENKVVKWLHPHDKEEPLTRPQKLLLADQLQSIKGLDFIWAMYLQNPDKRIAQVTKDQLLHLYHGYLDAQESAPYRQELVKRLVTSLHKAARGLSGKAAQADAAALAVSRCLNLALAAVTARESKTMPPVPAHHLAWRGTRVQLDVQQQPGNTRLRVTSHSNEYVGLLRERIARQLGCGSKHVRLILLGQELRYDSWTLPQDARNRALLSAMVSPEPNMYSLSPAEYKPYYEEMAFAWLLSQADGLYPLLLQLSDNRTAANEVPNMALELLSTLPTYPSLTQHIAAALDGQDKQQQLSAVFNSSSGTTGSSNVSSNVSSKGSAVKRDKSEPVKPRFTAGTAPYQTLYALQALCALLFPTFDETLLPLSADAEETMAEGSACPSPASAVGPTATATAAQPAASARLQQVHKVQHREQQQQEFLLNRGLDVVIDAAQQASDSSKYDLKLKRQLCELLVMLLHNLIDRAQTWNGQVAIAGDMVSGADSGDVAGTGMTAAAAALAGSSQRGGPAAGDRSPAAMSGVQHQQQQAEAGSCSVASGPPTEAPASAAVAAQAAVFESPQQRASSPSVEDAAMSSPPAGQQRTKQQPQQQQQSGKQQRHRSGDLPPLPPAVANGTASGTNNAAAAIAQSLATVFGSRTLKLVADTLLKIAVDTAQLWGTRATQAVSDWDDKVALAEAEGDIATAKEALGLLNLLLQHPALVQQLLLEGDQSQLITVVLVNPHYSILRRHAAELLEKLASGDVHPKMLQWLLMQLSAARKVAESMPASSTEFYELLAGTITRLGFVSNSNWGAVPQQLFVIAGQILSDEVMNLQAVAAAPAAAAAGNYEEAAAARRAGLLLQGRLQLVLALVRTLDKRSVGSDSEGGLIRLLLQDFLFPEAVQQLTAAAGRLDLADCAVKLEPRCATSSCRKAALELLSELMGDSATSLEEGVGLLIDLHYQQQLLLSWNLQPRMLRAPGTYVGLKNGGATCYMNAVFQQLFMQPQIRSGVLAAAEVERAQASESVFAQLQAMFANMAVGKATFLAPREFWYAFKDYDGTPIDTKEHQDAYEFFTRLQDFVDQHLLSTGEQPAIKPVMGGTFVQQIICRGVDYTSERIEEFYQISVDVKGMGCLEKSLDDYVKGELMEGDNAYLVEHLGKRVAAVKRTAIKELPQMLCIHLKRFEFDYHNQTRYKVRDRFEFPLELDMFKYSADGLAAQDQQQKAAEQQQGQAADPASSSGDGGASSANTSTSGGVLGRQVSDAVQQALAAKAKESSGAAGAAYMYDLQGVVVHAGSAFTGHYYSFIQERKERHNKCSSSLDCQWFLFDDKQVTRWDLSELERDCFGGRPSQDSDGRIRPTKNEYERAHSAYMLFYERRQQSAVSNNSGARQSVASSCGQQQQEHVAAAAANGDVPMAAAADDPQQQQSAVPYNMPVGLYQQVVRSNIHLMWSQHVLDKDYFRFVRQLVDSKGDLGQLSHRKSRRRDSSVTAARAGGSAGRPPSSMSCDLPSAAAGTRTPTAGFGSDGADGPPTTTSPSPMAVSPAPSTAQLSAAADGAVLATPVANTTSVPNTPRLSPLTLSPAPDQRGASPGPSSRRNEEAEAVAVSLLRLGVLFQFSVYLRAADSLRSESNVWTEALMGLMGAGPSSSACLQSFLELSVLHSEWLQQFLVDAEEEVPAQPKRWAVDMISWAFEAAAKRVSSALNTYLTHFIAAQQFLAPGVVPGQPAAASPNIPQDHQIALLQTVDQWQQQLPPLAVEVLAFVDKLVLLVRDCVPVKRGRRSNPNQLLEPPDVPADAVKVLTRYAALGPCTAAHLMMAVNLVPDLADIITAYISATDEDDFLADELVPLYELLYELLQHASNIPQLTEELCNQPRSCSPPNPYLTTAAQLASTSQTETAPGGQQSSNGVVIRLPQQAYRVVCSEQVLHGLLYPTCAGSTAAVGLGGLLSWNNSTLSTHFLKAVGSQLHKSLQADTGSGGKSFWSVAQRHWSLIALQPDVFVQNRVAYWLLGTFEPQTASRQRSPCVLLWAENNWSHIISVTNFLEAFTGYLKEHPGPAQYAAVRHCILEVLGEHQQMLKALDTFSNCTDELRDIRETALGLLHEIELVTDHGQQQLRRLGSLQQQQHAAADDDDDDAAAVDESPAAVADEEAEALVDAELAESHQE